MFIETGVMDTHNTRDTKHFFWGTRVKYKLVSR